ncbi:hypothetical protein DFJ58DRAFT_845793 [Suillus subalutaceus]|uniref:uncharacterized protein n=1 Tax=Suillus subalutaceus TaxID=48586 RepID=UPI001B8717AE|nr:uncharacterized protein DFJ58DRAFT_845793 [Suillus subalutaceus]KAG1839106.1 hypothetical protein DFJ58DRAFT_845793 [Suillus subalutaceus]
MPVVLAHHPSMDCIFACSGGLFLGYPELMDNYVTLFPLADTHSHTTQYFREHEYKVQISNSSWTSPCGRKCPTLWRHMEDSLLVTWQKGTVPVDIIKGQELLWRLNSLCSNVSCTNFIFRDPDPNAGACAKHTVDLRITDSQSRNGSLPCIMGLLFGAAMTRPCAVPLYLDKGRVTITKISDLNMHPFVRKSGMEPANIIDCSVTRQKIVMGNCVFTIIRDHDHLLDTIPSFCHVGPFYDNRGRYIPLAPPQGNMLVVMHDHVMADMPRNIRTKEFAEVARCVINLGQNMNELVYSLIYPIVQGIQNKVQDWEHKGMIEQAVHLRATPPRMQQTVIANNHCKIMLQNIKRTTQGWHLQAPYHCVISGKGLIGRKQSIPHEVDHTECIRKHARD